MVIFLASLNSKVTREYYLNGMKYFKNFGKFNTFQELLYMDTKKLSEMIEDYILFRRETNNPNSIGCYYFPIQTFLEMNDVTLNFKKLKRLFPAKIKTTIQRGWNVQEIQKMLNVCSNTKQRAIIHFESASGSRIGIFNGLKIKHLIPIIDSIGKCYGITGYAGEIEEYITFLTPEATQALDDYFTKRKADHEILSDDSPVFRTNYKIGSDKVTSASSKTLGSIPRYIQKKAGLRNTYDKKWNRYPIQTNHGFRHRFNEIIKSVQGINIHLAEKMFAHTSRIISLDGVYNTPKIENSFNEYKKIIPLLTIDQTHSQKAELKIKDKEIHELQTQNKIIIQLQTRQDRLEREILVRRK